MKTVLCHGVFDLIHYGHIEYFKAAKKFGDHLTVSITADRYVKKGPGRPHFPADIRKKMLESFTCVDKVIINDAPTAVPVIESLKPDFYVKGPDYQNFNDDITGGILEEKAAVEFHGGKLVFTKEPTFSSSELINRYLHKWTPEQQLAINEVKSLGGLPLIKKLLNEIEQLNISVVGEFITDRYVFCEPTGISNKGSSISAKQINAEEYKGGTWYIIANLSEFVSSINVHWQDNIHTKTRFITKEGNQKIFEIVDLQTKDNFIDENWLNETSDLLFVCDFGHGLFEHDNLELLTKVKVPIALNVQTNSTNIGFNPFTKHKRFNYLTLDLKEARLAIHDRYSTKDVIFENVIKKVPSDIAVAMTEGPHGSRYINNRDIGLRWVPTFTDKVVDATGAGDAFFAITSLFNHVGAPPELIPFVGNVFAGLKTEIMGTSRPVGKVEFLKTIEGILK